MQRIHSVAIYGVFRSIEYDVFRSIEYDPRFFVLLFFRANPTDTFTLVTDHANQINGNTSFNSDVQGDETDEEGYELFNDSTHEWPVYEIRRFEMVKYSFGTDNVKKFNTPYGMEQIRRIDVQEDRLDKNNMIFLLESRVGRSMALPLCLVKLPRDFLGEVEEQRILLQNLLRIHGCKQRCEASPPVKGVLVTNGFELSKSRVGRSMALPLCLVKLPRDFLGEVEEQRILLQNLLRIHGLIVREPVLSSCTGRFHSGDGTAKNQATVLAGSVPLHWLVPLSILVNFLIGEVLPTLAYEIKQQGNLGRKPMEFQVGDKVMLKVSPWKGVVRFGKRGKLNPRYVGPFKVLEKIGKVSYKLELPEELSRVHHTFHVSNLKKCHADEPLAFPLDGLHFDDKLHFVEEPVEIMDREVKWLKRSRILLVKVRWNSKRGPEFTWEREDQLRKKYPHLFAKTAPSSSVAS
nr:putative reverse transcriptase domain-containing protein [Tanacetum cinerariifolium]